MDKATNYFSVTSLLGINNSKRISSEFIAHHIKLFILSDNLMVKATRVSVGLGAAAVT